MKSGIFKIAAVIVLLSAIAACATTPPPVEKEETISVRSPWTVIDHQNAQLGGNIPDWLTADVGALEVDSRFTDNYVFKVENFGRDLLGVKNQTNNTFINTEVARIIQTRVEQKYVEAQVGDQNSVEAYFENVVQVLANVNLSGLRKYGEYWLLRVHSETGEEQYAYYTLYVINKKILDDQVKAAIDGAPAQTEEEQTARERVREIFAQGL